MNHLSSLSFRIVALSLVLLLGACSENGTNTNPLPDGASPVKNITNEANETSPLWVTGVNEVLVQGRPALSLGFSAELDPFRSYSEWLSVYNEKHHEINSEWVLSEDQRNLYFTDIEAKKSYRIVIKPGMPAKKNYILSEDKTLNITTRHLSATAAFSAKGMIVPAGAQAGLPVRSVNVKQISVDYFKVPVERFERLLSRFDTASSESGYSLGYFLSNATHIYSADYELPGETDSNIETKLPLETKITDTPGIYFAVLRRDGVYDDASPITYFTVSDIGLHLRQYKNKWSLFSSELNSGLASEGVHIRLLDYDGKLISEGMSNKQGLVSLAVPDKKPGHLILATKNHQLALLELDGPDLDISEFDMPEKPFRAREFFIYGPRDVYRPGEALEFSLLLRDFDGRLLPAVPVIAELRRPDGVTANQQTLSPQQNGYYQYRYDLSQSDPTGSWSLHFRLPDDTSPGARKTFLVEDFMPERIRMAFSIPTGSIIAQAQFDTLSVHAEYLYGAPAAGNVLSTELRISPARTPFTALPKYEFGPIQAGSSFSSLLDDQNLNANGVGKLVLDKYTSREMKAIDGPIKLSFRSSIFESGGRPIQRDLTVYSWQQGVWPGIQARFDTGNNTLRNESVPFRILATDASGKLLEGRSLDATLIKLNRHHYWEYTENNGWHYPYTETPETVWNKQYISAKSAIDVLAPVDKGYYQLHVRDESGNTSSLPFKIGQTWWGYDNNSNNARPDKVKITLDKPNYKAGDTLKVQLQAPRPGNGFLIVENSEGILYSERIKLKDSAREFTIQIPAKNEDWQRHDLRIVTLIAQPEKQAKNGVPMRSLGIQPIPLNRDQRKLGLSLDTAAKVEPQSNMIVKVHSDQLSQNMMVTISAVDQGVLSVTDFATPDPFAFFYQLRETRVSARDNFNEVLHLNDLAFARQRSGGDAEELTRGGERPESNIEIVSLFKGPLQFDEKGVAEVSFKMPDFNGAVRVMATAFLDERFGSAETEVIVKAPVVTQLSLPRFASYGDQTQLTLDIQNTLEETQSLQLNWEFDGATMYQPAQKTIRIQLAKDQKQVIQLPVIITRATGTANISLRVQGGGIDFQRQWRLGLRPAYPAMSFQKNNFLQENESVAVDEAWLDGTLADTLQLQLGASPYPSLNTAEQWRQLLKYPYGCLEQTTSRARPLALADEKMQQDWGVSLPEGLNRVEAVQTAINRLQTMQRPEGGFGLWNSHSAEERWLTAYVSEFLLSAREQGFDVPQEMLDKAIERLQHYVRNNNIPTRRYTYGDDEHRRFAYRSYAAFVLAKQAKAPLGSLRQWLDHYDSESKSPLPLAHLAIALKLQGDGERAVKAMKLAEQTHRADAYLGDYGSEIRDQALLLKLNIEYQLSLTGADTRLEHLSKLIYRRSYLSTQERDAIVQLALALSGENKSKPWSARLNQAAASKIITSTDNWSQIFKGVDVADISLTANGKQRIYASQTLIAQTIQAPQKESNGFSIRRNWYHIDGKPITSKQFKSGDFVIVRLSVSTDARSPDALIVDMLPAGFELENPGLTHSTPLSNFLIDGQPLSEVNSNYANHLKHKEYRDDRFIAAVDINTHATLELTYLMRAVTPGQYQVPSAFVEDMYQPERRAIGSAFASITIKGE